MSLKPIQLAAGFDGVSTKKDGSVSIRISTQELTSDQKMQVMEYVNQQGWFMFAPNRFVDDDVPKSEAPSDEVKTSSQRLRAVIWRYWEKKGKQGNFNQFYDQQVEHLIEIYKQKLD